MERYGIHSLKIQQIRGSYRSEILFHEEPDENLLEEFLLHYDLSKDVKNDIRLLKDTSILITDNFIVSLEIREVFMNLGENKWQRKLKLVF